MDKQEKKTFKSESIASAKTQAKKSSANATGNTTAGQRGPNLLRSLKSEKDMKGKEEILKMIKQELEGNYMIKKAYLDSGLAADIVVLLGSKESNGVIQYFSLSVLNESIYDTKSKEIMMNDGIPQKVMAAMDNNIQDKHMISEGCKFLKKMMIQTDYSKKFTSLGLIDLIKNVIKNHRFETKVLLEACKCLRQVMSHGIHCEDLGKQRDEAILSFLRSGKGDIENQMELVKEAQQSLEYYKDLDFKISSGFITVVLEKVKSAKSKELSTSLINLLESIFHEIENARFEQKITIVKMMVNEIENNSIDASLNVFCVNKLVKIVTSDDKMKEDIVKLGAGKTICSAMAVKYIPNELKYSNIGMAHAESKSRGDDAVIISCCQFLQLFFENFNMTQSLIENRSHRDMCQAFQQICVNYDNRRYYDEKQIIIAQQYILVCMQHLTRSPDAIPILREDYQMIHAAIFNGYASNDPKSFELQQSILLDLTDAFQQKYNMALAYIEYHSYSKWSAYFPYAIENIAHLIDIDFMQTNMMFEGMCELLIEHIVGNESFDDICAGEYILYILLQNPDYVERLRRIGTEQAAQHGIAICPNHRSKLFVIHHSTQYYCEMILKRFQTPSIANSSDAENTFVKSAATSRKEE